MNEEGQLSRRKRPAMRPGVRTQPTRGHLLVRKLADRPVEIGKRLVQFALAKNGGSDVITIKLMVTGCFHISETHKHRN